MASSSSQSIQNYHYHVFLSFRGSDTRQTFVSHLYKALCNRGILTFKDDRELEKGDSITDEICRAIRSSRFAVVVISENYASSRWCLDELQLIMELQLGGELTVFPIFYRVEPSDVRYQKGCFAESFQKHETRENAENVSSWRKALNRL
ncbi:Toll/interleukin-1 receptor homology (TIR) domain, partial [Arabidopsis suecica]